MSVSRRSVLVGLASALPAVGATAATAIIEPALEPGDLIVIKCDKLLSQEQVAQMEQELRTRLPTNQPVLILAGGVSLTVHRGVVKVEMPK